MGRAHFLFSNVLDSFSRARRYERWRTSTRPIWLLHLRLRKRKLKTSGRPSWVSLLWRSQPSRCAAPLCLVPSRLWIIDTAGNIFFPSLLLEQCRKQIQQELAEARSESTRQLQDQAQKYEQTLKEAADASSRQMQVRCMPPHRCFSSCTPFAKNCSVWPSPHSPVAQCQETADRITTEAQSSHKDFASKLEESVTACREGIEKAVADAKVLGEQRLAVSRHSLMGKERKR